MRNILKILLGYWLEIVIGIFILSAIDDIRWFLMYFFLIYLISSERRTDYLRKLIRVYQVANELKILTIIRKLRITDDELMIVADDEKSKMGSKAWESIEREIKELESISGN